MNPFFVAYHISALSNPPHFINLRDVKNRKVKQIKSEQKDHMKLKNISFTSGKKFDVLHYGYLGFIGKWLPKILLLRNKEAK